MASTTPNIGLTLPTGTEKVSRQVINTNNTKIDTNIGTLNSKIVNKNVTGNTTASMENCTVTYTTNEIFVYDILGGALKYLRIRKRGNITAVDSNPYSLMKLTNIDLSNYNMLGAITYYRELSSAHFQNTVGNVIASSSGGNNYIQIQQIGGLTANQWKVGNGFYIDVGVLFIKNP